MSRIAAALLIVIAVLAVNGGLVRPAFAEAVARAPAPSVEVSQPITVRSGRVLNLLMALEALRLSQVTKVPQKG